MVLACSKVNLLMNILEWIEGDDFVCMYICLPRYLESHWFVWVSQMNHIPMNIAYDKNDDWVSTQVISSPLLGIIWTALAYSNSHNLMLRYRLKIIKSIQVYMLVAAIP